MAKYPLFKMLIEPVDLNRERDYSVPAGATHVGIYAGQIAFFQSDCVGDYFRGRKWKYYALMVETRAVAFSEYAGLKAGDYNYGKPQFQKGLAENIIPRNPASSAGRYYG